MKYKTMRNMFLGGLALFFISAFLIAEIVSNNHRIKQLENQLEFVENHFQVYRSAAEDAYGWAIGSDSEYGEKIPGEFFWRYSDDVKDEKRIVRENGGGGL